MNKQPSDLALEVRAALVEAIGHLSETQASIVVQFYLYNQTLEQVAERLMLSPEEISIERHAALLTLRRITTRLDGDY